MRLALPPGYFQKQVVAAAVILDPKRIPKGLDDSKRLTAEKRYVASVDRNGFVCAPKEPWHTHSDHAETVSTASLEVSCQFSAGVLAAHHENRCEALSARTTSYDHPAPQPATDK